MSEGFLARKRYLILFIIMATTTITSPVASPETLTSSAFRQPMGGIHQRRRSVSVGDEDSPNNFVFPRKAPSSNGSHFTRPRSGTSDAVTLLAEIGVLPPPGSAAAARLKTPTTQYVPNRQRPQSMLAMPLSVILAPASDAIGSGGDSSGTGHDRPTLAPPISKDISSDEEGHKQLHSGPPPGHPRRGHAHRRSGAISSSDVWSVLTQVTPAPTHNGVHPPPKVNLTPSIADVQSDIAGIGGLKQSSGASVSPSSTGDTIVAPPPSPTLLVIDKKPMVALTERVDIPRVLPSTTSSVTTITAPASVTTIATATATTTTTTATTTTTTLEHGNTSGMGIHGPPLPRNTGAPATSGPNRSPTRNRSTSISSSQSPLSPELQAQFAHIIQRPRTAGAILSPPITPTSVPEEPVPQLPVPQIEPVPVPHISIADAPNSPSRTSTSSEKDHKHSHKKDLSDGPPKTPSSPPPVSPTVSMGKKSGSSCKTKKGDKRKKKQLRNFLFGKSKNEKFSKHGRALKRSPTPPSRHNSFRKQGEMTLPAWTESYVLLQEGSMAGRSLEELSSTMSPRYAHFGSDRDSPIIDLDAALGPLNSPMIGASNKSSGGFNAAKRRMHSSGAGGKMSIASGVISNSFIGTHRRSESMPEFGMPLFDLAEHAGMEMDDVFEEEEEAEEDEESCSGSDTGSETDESEVADGERRMSTGGLGIGIQVTDGDGVTTWEAGVSLDLNHISLPPRRSSLAPTLASNSSLKNSSIREEEEPAEGAAAAKPASIFSHHNDSAKSCSLSPGTCSTPTSLVPSAQSSTSTVTPISAVSMTAPSLLDAPASSCSVNNTPPSSSPINQNASLTSHRDSLTLKELVDLSLQEGSEFDPYADSELRLLGEPGPELRMGGSVDDVPSLTSSSSTMTSTYATYCSTGALQQPSTPRIEEIPVAVVDELPIDGKAKPKGLKKKWSRVFKFWESDEKKGTEDQEEKERPHKEKKDKSKEGKESKHKGREKKGKKEKVKEAKGKDRGKILI